MTETDEVKQAMERAKMGYVEDCPDEMYILAEAFMRDHSDGIEAERRMIINKLQARLDSGQDPVDLFRNEAGIIIALLSPTEGP